MSVIPRVIGKYEILRALATGGMAEIFVARVRGIEGFQKVVVIKRLRREIAGDPQFVQMFLDEVRVLATLQHANIVEIYDVGSVDGSYFFAMELLRGEDARTLIKRARSRGGPMPLEHAIYLTMCTLAGLHFAHEKTGANGEPLDIVHRDISPSNVFVTYQGDVKVIDFGIAKTTLQSAQTQVGVIKGKVRYMSPEQCMSRPIDRRSDIFSTSVMLWEITVGKRLFVGNEFETLKQIIEIGAPPPSQIVPDYPPELERIVMKGLARDPDRRYATALEMQIDLDNFARDQRLASSSLSLGRYMSELFADSIGAWADAEQSGQAFIHYVGELFEARESSLGSLTSEAGPHSESHRTGRSSEDSVSRTNEVAAVPPVAPARSSSPLTLGAGALLLVGLGGALVWLLMKPASPVSSASTLSSSSALPSATAAAALIAAAPTPGPSVPSSIDIPAPSAAAAPPASATPEQAAPKKPLLGPRVRATTKVVEPAKPSSWDKESPMLPP